MSLPDGLPPACYPPRMKYHKALMLTVSMAEIAHKMKYYEITAICARKIAEMYVAIFVPEFTTLYEGMSKLPYDMDENVWNALREAKTIGNAGAHANERRMTECEGNRAMSAALIIANGYLAHVSIQRSKL